jgi:sulfotransferase family protein
MIGTQRSGSNMLRLMMNELDNFSAPHPPHILERLIPLLPAFGDLTIPENFYELVEHVCLLVEYNPVPWTGFSLDRDEIIDGCEEPCLSEVFRVIYDMLAEHEGSGMWMCKSMANVHYADILEKKIKPFYIHLYRDGRDVALSFKKAIVGEKHIYALASQWKKEQELSLALFSMLGTGRVMQIRYEDLIARPQQELKRICSALGLFYEDRAMDFYKSDESRKTAQSGRMWENVEKPVISNNHDKFRNELSGEDIKIFEQVAGDTLVKLGYALCFPDQPQHRFTDKEINFYKSENKKMKQESILRQSPEDITKRKRQDELLRKIRAMMPLECPVS